MRSDNCMPMFLVSSKIHLQQNKKCHTFVEHSFPHMFEMITSHQSSQLLRDNYYDDNGGDVDGSDIGDDGDIDSDDDDEEAFQLSKEAFNKTSPLSDTKIFSHLVLLSFCFCLILKFLN